MSAPDEYEVWRETLEALATSEGTTLIVGGVDVGKTTFTRLALQRLLEAKQSIALLDADVGQSEIGPPACIGLALPQNPVEALSELPPHALSFVGNITPQGNLLETLAAIQRLVPLAGERRLLVDTSGYIQGAGGRRLFHALCDLLAPHHIVALQRKDELSPLLAPLRRNDACTLHTPAVPEAITPKPPRFRAQRRTIRFATYFQNATLHTFSFDNVALQGTWLGGGTPVAAHLLKFLNQAFGAEYRVYYAETWGNEIGLMTNRALPYSTPEMSLALQEMHAQSALNTVAPNLKGLLMGLEDGKGILLGLGLLQALDFRRQTLGVWTPVRAPDAARVLRFGGLRLQPNGVSLGVVRPAEL